MNSHYSPSTQLIVLYYNVLYKYKSTPHKHNTTFKHYVLLLYLSTTCLEHHTAN